MSRKNPFALRSLRLPHSDVEAWRAAAAKSKTSLSQFLRQALRTAAHEVLEGNDEQCERPKADPKEDIQVKPMIGKQRIRSQHPKARPIFRHARERAYAGTQKLESK